MSTSSVDLSLEQPSAGVAAAAWHSLLWLVAGNAIGVMLGVLLLFPGLNPWLGEWTYGRWITVHMNLALYGWSSVPMLGFLFRVYEADRGTTGAWCRPVLWAWSAALAIGSITWLSGKISGKLFLDWSGVARIAFPLAMLALWVLLAAALMRNWNTAENRPWSTRLAKLIGLAILLAVPFAIYAASDPGVYPAVNPDTGGPTGTSQLESSLGVVAILLVIPLGIARRSARHRWAVPGAWILFAGESALCAMLPHTDITHHNLTQILSLGSMLGWLPVTLAYYDAFEWHANTRRWRIAFLAWWGALVVSGWIFFLPGVLDHFKFTDGLVGHSFVAMAGFLSALLIFVMVQLLGEDGWIFTRRWSFYLWNLSVLAYIVVITIAGWLEGSDPAFTIVLGPARNALYVLRLITGILMLIASVEWFIDASDLLARADSIPLHMEQRKVA